MGFKGLYRKLIISIIAFNFCFVARGSLVQAKDDQLSPLFGESLEETLQDFNLETKIITRHDSLNNQSQTKALETEQSQTKTLETEQSQTKALETEQSQTKALETEQSQTKALNRGGIIQSINPNRGNQGVSRITLSPAICNRPTLRGSTCRGLKCYACPTLVGSTCYVTCGTRSTCSNGWFCKRHPSPSVKRNNPDCLVEGKGQSSLIFNIL